MLLPFAVSHLLFTVYCLPFTVRYYYYCLLFTIYCSLLLLAFYCLPFTVYRLLFLIITTVYRLLFLIIITAYCLPFTVYLFNRSEWLLLLSRSSSYYYSYHYDFYYLQRLSGFRHSCPESDTLCPESDTLTVSASTCAAGISVLEQRLPEVVPFFLSHKNRSEAEGTVKSTAASSQKLLVRLCACCVDKVGVGV